MTHISPYVGFWTALAFIYLWFSVFRVLKVLDDDRNMRQSGLTDRDLTIVSRAAIRNATGRLLVGVVFLTIGLKTGAEEAGLAILHFGDVLSWEFIAAILILTFLSYLDHRERHALHQALAQRGEERVAITHVAELTAATHQETLAAIRENTRITRQADEHAQAAYHEANSVNLKIKAGNAATAGQVEAQATASAAQLDAISEMGRDTNIRTQDVQSKTDQLVDSLVADRADNPEKREARQ